MREGVVFRMRLPSRSMVVDTEESLLNKSVQTIEVDVREYGTQHPSGNVANRLAELSIRIPRARLRPAYGDGFQGAPLKVSAVQADAK
jgi:hypothetical protein